MPAIPSPIPPIKKNIKKTLKESCKENIADKNININKDFQGASPPETPLKENLITENKIPGLPPGVTDEIALLIEAGKVKRYCPPAVRNAILAAVRAARKNKIIPSGGNGGTPDLPDNSAAELGFQKIGEALVRRNMSTLDAIDKFLGEHGPASPEEIIKALPLSLEVVNHYLTTNRDRYREPEGDSNKWDRRPIYKGIPGNRPAGAFKDLIERDANE